MITRRSLFGLIAAAFAPKPTLPSHGAAIARAWQSGLPGPGVSIRLVHDLRVGGNARIDLLPSFILTPIPERWVRIIG